MLVVEDEFFIADDLVRALRVAGAEVLGPVQNLERALTIISNEAELDAAVLDISLGRDMSYAIADRLLQLGMPFVIATGYARDSLPSRFQHVPYWEKPYDPRALASSLPGVMLRR
ncbi:response regulator [Pararoseomonas baculiformis]|uniref:response regulator n=1 Tax=Pararoseomonas baculiformis TaxID=2820812 RepID=UPI003158D6E5